MYSPLVENVTYKPNAYGCGVPFCGHWTNHEKHGLCDFHYKLANRQIGEPFTADPDLTHEENGAAYKAHQARALRHIPFHMMMASLWPGVYSEERSRSVRRDKSLKAKWQEQGDRDG